MTWKPSATANDWERWKRAEVSPPMTIERVTVEGIIQGKRAKLEMTQGFIQMQAALKHCQLELEKLQNDMDIVKDLELSGGSGVTVAEHLAELRDKRGEAGE